ncbi:MAG: OmpA family protein [Pseudobdellovibrionaceae bacterium]
MRHPKLLLAVAATLMISACGFHSTTEVGALNQAQAVGSPFTQQITPEYREFAQELENEADYADSLHFARKGLATAEGEAVLPEPIADWNVTPPQITELAPARERLLLAFDRAGREVAPKESALAQAKFDCWIEQEEENWTSPENVTCKNEFMNAMAALEGKVGKAPPAAPSPDMMSPVTDMNMAPTGPMKVEDAKYLVFFDFDKSEITDSAQSVLDAVAQEVKSRQLKGINVIGHTDTSGTNEYNQALGERRASSVDAALAARGVPQGMMATSSRGETELMVQTPDGVREPANRRVEISFE